LPPDRVNYGTISSGRYISLRLCEPGGIALSLSLSLSLSLCLSSLGSSYPRSLASPFFPRRFSTCSAEEESRFPPRVSGRSLEEGRGGKLLRANAGSFVLGRKLKESQPTR
jgi:hypothetical protein